MSERYHNSENLLARACETVPLGSQTFSKSKTQFPYGVSPYFISHGKGSRVWDVDGNEYIDFVNSLLAVSLGYCDPDVDAAVRGQMDKGVTFSLPHQLEMEVAEKVVDLVPCAEMVRFGKNGSDATSGAIRLARAYTGRDLVAVCGYHGWQDWYIGSTARSLGVPKATQKLTLKFEYNKLTSLQALFDQYPGQIAAVILEPMNVEYPQKGFLEGVKELAHKNGAVLVFDETITGFRFSKGGAQELFGVTPDLCTMGKGLANGYPLSLVAGRKEIMQLMEEIFFSFTFGGETLSLAAAKALMDKLDREPVLESIHQNGQLLLIELKSLIQKHQLGNILAVSGHPSWSFLHFKDTSNYSLWQIKTLWMQEILARGILCFGAHNISYAHSIEDIQALLAIYNEVFTLMHMAIENNDLCQRLKGSTLEPLFKVR